MVVIKVFSRSANSPAVRDAMLLGSRMSARAVILVTGRDPQRYADDSHCGYVRAHAYGATQAGYNVSIMCLGEKDRIETTAYGTVHPP